MASIEGSRPSVKTAASAGASVAVASPVLAEPVLLLPLAVLLLPQPAATMPTAATSINSIIRCFQFFLFMNLPASISSLVYCRLRIYSHKGIENPLCSPGKRKYCNFTPIVLFCIFVNLNNTGCIKKTIVFQPLHRLCTIVVYLCTRYTPSSKLSYICHSLYFR
ncbi:hypothetical protein D3C81_1665310 [compost metagenome]